MRSCEGLSRYSMLKISFRIGSIALSTLARADLICMSSVNFEPIIKSLCFWKCNTIGKYFRMASLYGLSLLQITCSGGFKRSGLKLISHWTAQLLMFFEWLLRLLTVLGVFFNLRNRDVSPVHNLDYTEDCWTSRNYR